MTATQTNINNLTDIIDLTQTQTAYINGRYLAVDDSLSTFEDINPATGEVLAIIQQTTTEQIDEAVKAAQQGQKVWAALALIGSQVGRYFSGHGGSLGRPLSVCLSRVLAVVVLCVSLSLA